MGQVYLIRHGQTAWNKARIFRGRADVRLNEQGRREAAAAAQALRDIPFARLYASPLSRARETAQIIAARSGVEVVPDPAFIDIDYGDWTEYWDVEARRKFRDQYLVWEEQPHLMRFPNGESLDDIRRRSAARLRELARQHQSDTIGIVSHRAVLKMLIAEVKALDNSRFWEIRLDTGAISVIEAEGDRLRLVVENDTRHVQSLPEHSSLDF